MEPDVCFCSLCLTHALGDFYLRVRHRNIHECASGCTLIHTHTHTHTYKKPAGQPGFHNRTRWYDKKRDWPEMATAGLFTLACWLGSRFLPPIDYHSDCVALTYCCPDPEHEQHTHTHTTPSELLFFFLSYFSVCVSATQSTATNSNKYRNSPAGRT